MGYQESYVTTVDEKNFTGLCDYIRSVGKDYYDVHFTLPVEIITLENGKQYIYFSGERYLQNNKARLLGYISDDDDFNSEERRLSMWEWLEKIVVIFTEDMSPNGIWEDAGDPVTAKHEKFEF